MSELVTYQSNERIALITINRAERMNALNEGVITGLQAAWRQFEDSDDRVAIVHAAGDRAFSVGTDVNVAGCTQRRRRRVQAGHSGGARLVYRRRLLHRANV